MATSSTDVCESSDILHEYPCKPCADDDKNIEGVHFCSECQTYFCLACIQFHNKCFKTHTIFNKSGMKSGKIQYEQQQDWLACEKHAGYLIQMYCGEHDTVCCSVCVAVDHRLCKSADFIPKLSKAILNGRDRKDVKTSLEEIWKQLQTLKARKLEQIKDVGKEKDENLKEIKRMKEHVIARVDELEQNSVKQVQEKHDRIVGAIKTDIDCMDVKLNAIASSIDKINTFKANNEAKLFVVLNKAHEVEVGSISLMDKDGDGKYDKIEFEISFSISSFLSKVDGFGSVKSDSVRVTTNEITTHSQIPEASLVKQVSVKGSDSCMLDNGQIIILGKTHLQRLDETYKLLDTCPLKSGAKHLCKVGPTKIAVLYFYSFIEFVDAGRSLLITNSFRISENNEIYPAVSGKDLEFLRCQGMSFIKKKLLVCVGLRYDGYDYDKGSLHNYKVGVSIYDLNGSHIETCMVPIDDDYDIEINHATYNSYDSCMYIATITKGLLVFDMTDKKMSKITNNRLKNPQYVCEGRKGLIFVCGKDSHNVFLVDRENDSMEEILGSMDGIQNPCSVMYIEQQNCLLVTSSSEEIKIYQLK